jgi:hypothetical protein
MVPKTWMLFGGLCFLASMGWAQFSSSIQGTVSDPSAAVIPKALVRLQNVQTGVSRELQTSDAGYYRFSSLPPGNYEVTVSGSGFQAKTLSVQVTIGESRGLDFPMQVQTSSSSIQVAGVAPILDTAESRQQITMTQDVVRDLPLQGNSFFTLLALAPGVVGTNGATDNFNTEYFTTISANGRSAYGNSFTVDGVNANSNITNGTSNIMLNPDAIQEVTIETNTFKAEQGIGSSAVISIASKAGTNQFHGAGNYFFRDQDMQARTSLPFVAKYQPYTRQDVTGAFGGPIVKNKTFFFASVDMLRSKTASVSTLTYESPQFVAWASQNFPGTVGTKLLNTYPITGAVQTSVAQTVLQALGGANCGPGSATGIPCDMPYTVLGTWSGAPFRNGLQYNFRGDQYIRANDRLYGSYVASTNTAQSLASRGAFSYSILYHTKGIGANWTHTFSSHLLNELSFGATSIVGGPMTGGLFNIPSISITNTTGEGQGTANTYSQKNYTWKDAVTWLKGTHTLKMGGTFFWGNDLNLNPFGNRPTFQYQNLLAFVQDQIYTGTYGTYDPLTGKPKIFDMGAKMTTESMFVQDEWKARPNLNLTASLRWDDFGNPVGVNGMTGLSQFVMTDVLVAPGNTVDQQFATASVQKTSNGAQYAHRLDRNVSPRFGVAWSPQKSGKTSVRGGIGLYNDWVTLGESVDRVNFNPPNYLTENFSQTLPLKPPAAPLLGTNNNYSNFFGFNLPTFPATPLNSLGGLVGVSSSVGGVNPNLVPPRSLNYMIGVQRELPARLVVGASYSGSYAWDGLTGTDYNRFPLGLSNGVQTRLNTSFGQIWYVTNTNVIHYNAMILTARKDLGARGTIQGSYTLSHTTNLYDGGARSVGGDTSVDPRLIDSYPADASYDVRQRLSASGVFRFPTPFGTNFLAKRVLGGWELASTAILQTGTPFTIYNGNNRAAGGDYNSDGYNYDYPNIPSGLPQIYPRSSFLGANAGQPAYIASQFTVPTLGTQGNSPRNGFRNQGLINMDASVIKSNRLRENWNLQLKFEFFNVLNRVNLGGITNNLGSVNFGKITGQGATRVVQIGARLTF